MEKLADFGRNVPPCMLYRRKVGTSRIVSICAKVVSFLAGWNRVVCQQLGKEQKVQITQVGNVNVRPNVISQINREGFAVIFGKLGQVWNLHRIYVVVAIAFAKDRRRTHNHRLDQGVFLLNTKNDFVHRPMRLTVVKQVDLFYGANVAVYFRRTALFGVQVVANNRGSGRVDEYGLLRLLL